MAVEQRYDYIDTLKGGAMIFVVLYHSCFLNTFYSPTITFVPLFFMVSGFLFRADISWKSLLLRSLRVLLLPYLTFNILCVILYNSLHAVGVNMPCKDIVSIFYTNQAELIPNVTTWYLLVLFEVVLFFKAMSFLIKSFSITVRSIVILLVSLVMGYVGYMLSRDNICLPYLLQVAFVAVLFFGLGYLFSIFIPKASSRYDRLGYWSILPMFIIYLLSRGYISMAAGAYELSYWRLLVMMVALFVSQFYLCKLIGRLPFVTYLGRYSLIVLCANMLVIPIMMGVALRFFDYDNAVIVSSIATLFVIRWLVVPFCIRFMPGVSGIKRL